MLNWLRTLRKALPIPETLWRAVLGDYPFLAAHSHQDLLRLRRLTAEFLQQKQFHGAMGLVITDPMALAIAVQAVLPLLHLPNGLDWYDDFVGIVVVPSEVNARQIHIDEAGVVHEYDEVIIGEARAHGPVMLSWPHVQEGGRAAPISATQATNVVIHEFAHKLDMRDGEVDGCPPLPSGFLGHRQALAARQHWLTQMQAAYDAFCEQAIVAERFGGEAPWLDDYATTSIGEFFAVSCEAFFVDRSRFAKELPTLAPLLEAFFYPNRRLPR